MDDSAQHVANGFDFSVPAAATSAAPIDTLFFTLLALSAVACFAIVGCIVYFCIKYRRGTAADRRNPPSRNRRIEGLWIGMPLAVFLGVFCWAAVLYARMFAAPPDAIDIFVVGKQWMWKVQHGSGKQEIDALHVPLGVPVRLIMTSQDVIHSFFVPAFRLKQDVLPGQYTALWFEATKSGSYPLECSEYCGTDHARMGGRVVVMPAERYQQWLTAHTAQQVPVERGAALFRNRGCAACHTPTSGLHAPALEHVYGTRVTLADGSTRLADREFLHAAIIDPAHHRLAGYEAVMPSFRGVLSDAEIDAIIDYLAASAQPAQTP